MDMNQTTAIPEVKDTIVMLRRLSADERIRQEAYYREKRMHDEANALGGARREGRAEGFAEGRAEGRAEGMTAGMISTLASLVEKGVISLSDAAAEANMTAEEFKKESGRS